MREKHEGYSQFCEINNFSCNPSHFFPEQIKEERGEKRVKRKKGGSRRECKRDFVQILFFYP